MGCSLGDAEVVLTEVTLGAQEDIVAALSQEDRERYGRSISMAGEGEDAAARVRTYAERKGLSYDDATRQASMVVDGIPTSYRSLPLHEVDAIASLIPHAVPDCQPSVLRVILANIRAAAVSFEGSPPWRNCLSRTCIGNRNRCESTSPSGSPSPTTKAMSALKHSWYRRSS